MDLFGGYLLVTLILFSANLALLFGNYRINNIKLAGLSLMYAAVFFALVNVSEYLKFASLFLFSNFSYLFLAISIIIFLVMILYNKERIGVKHSIAVVSIVFFISALVLASQSAVMFFDSLIYSLFVFIAMFLVYQASKLLVHAKRQYPIIVSEYMALFSILIFIFALTYYSTITLTYSQFSSFLILTPTYQLIYVIIGIVVVMIIGFLLDDRKGGYL